ncbi:hypothetical protein J6590_080873 [Homalodisca vitripennis]|nr:hypothetical protein J6590_080873 [Homalodisca vitripennis]
MSVITLSMAVRVVAVTCVGKFTDQFRLKEFRRLRSRWVSRERDSQLRRPLALSLSNRSLLPSGILLDSDRVEWTVEVSVRGLGLGIIVREPFGTISKLLRESSGGSTVIIPLEGALFRSRRHEVALHVAQFHRRLLRIDHAHHYNNPYRALEETLVLEDSLLEVLSVTDPLETLTVVTSDHSHVLTFGGLSTPLGNPILGTDTKVSDMDGLPYSTLLCGNGPGYAAPRSIPANTTSVNSVHGSTAPRQWATHAGEDVPVYAQGPLANRLFSGTLDRSFIHHAIAYIGCLGEHSKRCQDFNNTAAKQEVCDGRERVEVAVPHVQYMMGDEEVQWFSSIPI